MIDYKKVREDIEFLAPYEQADGTEWGEMINYLCLLGGRLDYISDELAEMVAKEISDNAEYVREHARIVETVETKEIITRKTIDIEWDDR
jgi:hypothetical protein